MSRGELERVAARVTLDLVGPRELTAAAVAAFAGGLDSPALRVLAGLDSDDGGEARRWLDQALSELGITRPGRRGAVLLLARELADAILDGTVTPQAGAARVWALTLKVPELQFPELDTFVYGASEWDERPEDRSRFEAGIRSAARELAGSTGSSGRRGL